jgi:hypothetical protein
MSIRAARRYRFLLATAVACCGCDFGDSTPLARSSTTRAKVRGKVTFKGKPLAKVDIQFNPANINRPTAATARASIDKDGRYEVTTLVGDNTVTLSGPALRKNTRLQYTARTLDAKEGENTFDLALP